MRCLDPHLDNLGRTYLYASNIAIDRGRTQPVHFALGEELRLTDAHGREMAVRIVDIAGRSALLEYRPPDAWTKSRLPEARQPGQRRRVVVSIRVGVPTFAASWIPSTRLPGRLRQSR